MIPTTSLSRFGFDYNDLLRQIADSIDTDDCDMAVTTSHRNQMPLSTLFERLHSVTTYFTVTNEKLESSEEDVIL